MFPTFDEMLRRALALGVEIPDLLLEELAAVDGTLSALEAQVLKVAGPPRGDVDALLGSLRAWEALLRSRGILRRRALDACRAGLGPEIFQREILEIPEISPAAPLAPAAL